MQIIIRYYFRIRISQTYYYSILNKEIFNNLTSVSQIVINQQSAINQKELKAIQHSTMLSLAYQIIFTNLGNVNTYKYLMYNEALLRTNCYDLEFDPKHLFPYLKQTSFAEFQKSNDSLLNKYSKVVLLHQENELSKQNSAIKIEGISPKSYNEGKNVFWLQNRSRIILKLLCKRHLKFITESLLITCNTRHEENYESSMIISQVRAILLRESVKYKLVPLQVIKYYKAVG